MRKTRSCLFTAWLSVGLALSLPVIAHGQLGNVGFEEGALEAPTAWRISPEADSFAMVGLDGGVAHSGSRSARIRCVDTDPRVGSIYNRWIQDLPSGDLSGRTVTVTAWVRTEQIREGHEAVLRIEALQTSYVSLVVAKIEARSTRDSGWTEICTQLDIPAEADTIRVSVGLDGVGAAWFDDLSLVAGARCRSELAEPTTHAPLILAGLPPAIEPATLEDAAPLSEPIMVKPWTIAIYNAADFQGLDPRDYFAQNLRTCEQYNVVMLGDSFRGGAKTWLVEEGEYRSTLRLLVDHGEIDTSAEETFGEFLRYCETWFPSERTMLLIYDHGGGWRGTARDENGALDSGDWLTPAEMRRSLEAIGGIDVLLYTAPCTMASLETAHEIGPLAGLTVASEEYSGFVLWLDALADLGAKLREAPGIALEELGRLVVDKIAEGQDRSQSERGAPPAVYFQMTAFLGAPIEGVSKAIDRLAGAMLAILPRRREAIVELRKDALALRDGELVDAGDFAKQCEILPELAEEAAAVQRALSEAIVRIAGNPEFADAQGLTVFFPRFRKYGDVSAAYGATGLFLLRNTRWEEFLEALYAEP